MYLQSGSGLAADGNADGQVDNADYDVWLAAFGQAAPGSGAGAMGGDRIRAAVPEPASIILFAIAAVLASCAGARRSL